MSGRETNTALPNKSLLFVNSLSPTRSERLSDPPSVRPQAEAGRRSHRRGLSCAIRIATRRAWTLAGTGARHGHNKWPHRFSCSHLAGTRSAPSHCAGGTRGAAGNPALAAARDTRPRSPLQRGRLEARPAGQARHPARRTTAHPAQQPLARRQPTGRRARQQLSHASTRTPAARPSHDRPSGQTASGQTASGQTASDQRLTDPIHHPVTSLRTQARI